MAKRQAKKLEPITLDDLLGNSSMEGLVSFLDLPARSDSLPHFTRRTDALPHPVGMVGTHSQGTVPTDSHQGEQPSQNKSPSISVAVPVGTIDAEAPPTTPSGAVTAMEDLAVRSSQDRPLSTVGGALVTTLDNRPVGNISGEVSSSSERYPLPTVVGGPVVKPIQPRAIVPVIYPSARWITEEGQVVSDKQIRPFRLAQDVLNANERALYSVLWNSKEARIDFGDPNTKIVRAGYETLAKQTNMAKKTIQRLVPRLLNKGFIEISENPNFFNRTAAAYKVFSFKRILEISAEQGRGYVAKLGHGVAFARPYATGPVPSEPMATVGNGPASTVRRKSPWTRDNDPLSTMDGRSTSSESLNSKEKTEDSPSKEIAERLSTPSSSLRDAPLNTLAQGLRGLLRHTQAEIDNEATERLWNQCRSRVPDCTADEVLHFSRAKTVLFSSGKINNPVGFLLFAVPKCFEGASFRQFRAEQEQLRKAEEERAKRAEQEMKEVQQQLIEMLNSPNSTEEDRKFAQRLLSERESN